MTSVKFSVQISSGRVSQQYNIGQLEPLTVFPMGPKTAFLGKIVKSSSLKSAVFRCSRLFPWSPMVPLDSACNFRGSLTTDFGSSGASLLFYGEWKSSKIAGFLLLARCYLSQTSTSESHLLAPNDLGTWRKLPQGTRELNGWL